MLQLPLRRVACANPPLPSRARNASGNGHNLLSSGAGANAEVRDASEALPLKRASFGMGGRRLNFLPLREFHLPAGMPGSPDLTEPYLPCVT